MRVLILEDERPAAEVLATALRAADPTVEVLAVLDSVEAAARWLAHDDAVQLVFADVRLVDGLSFEAFRRAPPRCPVVYVTAYDKYVVEAFEHGGIDYLLKPLDPDRLARTLEKYARLRDHFAPDAGSRLLVRRGREVIAVSPEDVAWFCTEHRLVFLVRRDGARFLVDRTLADLEAALDPRRFHRVNRSWIVARAAVRGFHPHGKGRLAVALHPPTSAVVVVPAEGAEAFRKWLAG